MNIKNNRLLFVAQYAAPYEGNFIASLKALEVILYKEYGCEVAYVFPKLASSQAWMNEFRLKHRTFLFMMMYAILVRSWKKLEMNMFQHLFILILMDMI